MKERADKIEKEYNKFKERMLKNTPSEIYDRCGEIAFYRDVTDYLINSSYEIHPKISLGLLWHYYLSYENVTTNTWDGIYDFITLVEENFE